MGLLFSSNKSKVIAILVLLLSIILVALLTFPVGYGIIRLGILIAIALIYLGILYLSWKNRILKSICLGLAIAISIAMISPAKVVDAEALRERYVQKLIEFDHVGYVYGGENSLGIDCSGLVREALIKANVEIGISTANPYLLRRALEIWWFDAGADALRDGYRNFTRQVLFVSNLNALDYRQVLKGDLAASEDGGHILAYEGDKKWIEASPEANRVIRFQVPESSRTFPVYLLRWMELN
jgi:energy-coupling factor transporter transmembrane protein EcfT